MYYMAYSLKTKFPNVHAMGCALGEIYRDCFEILEQESDYQRCTSMYLNVISVKMLWIRECFIIN